MKKILNQQGGSLVQVMVIAGMVSVFGLAVMQTSKNMNSLRQTAAMRDSLEQFKESISNLMLNDAACVQTLSGNGITMRAQAVDKSFVNIFNSNGDSVYKYFKHSAAEESTFHGNIRIKSMTFAGYNPADNSARIIFELYKRYIHNDDKTDINSVGINILGGDTITYELPLRVFFTIPDGGAPSATDPIASCFGEYKKEDSGINPLEELCDDDLGGSYYNGRCLVTEYIMDRTRCWTGNDCGDPDDPDTAQRSLCHNLGGRFDPATGRCTPRFSGATACPAGEVLSGFDAEGRFICTTPGTPPPGTTCGSALAGYGAGYGCCNKTPPTPTTGPGCTLIDDSFSDLDLWQISGCGGPVSCLTTP